MTSLNRTGDPIQKVRTVLPDVLKDDPVLYSHMGLDAWENRKVYEIVGPPDVTPPYLIWAILDTGTPEGTYGDLKSIEAINFQVGGWGVIPTEAVQLFELAEEALDLMDPQVPELLPYKLESILRVGFEVVHDERVNWFQAVATYRVVVTR